ncbi:MAG: phenylalanine--tRNA ligase subunit beta [Verrucomicrobiales bacterium]
MIVSLSWLQQHVDLSGLGTSEISDLLTFAGVEVEGITERGIRSDKVVVAQVVTVEQHPNADRLKVCQVDAGGGAQHQIVCGATNYKVGDKIPLALPGAILPGNFEIKAGKLRGVESGGMMCSGRELGLSDDHGGLLILPADAAVGTALHQIVPADTILEIEITPNRPDLLSHHGLACELAALTGHPLRALDTPTVTEAPAGELVAMRTPDACPFYSARLIEGVKVGPSPDWLRDRLLSIGLRPINNIVDITNFVLHETGQPLHAFDRDRLRGGNIIVRAATAGEKFLALDGKEYTLEESDTVIADQSRPVALGGVMGGEDSGVGDTTVNVLLESAWFEPSGIRRTARRTALSSDSSYRFERGADPGMVLAASALATRLILECAGGKASGNVSIAGELPKRTGVVSLDPEHAKSFLGGHLEKAEQDAILEKLGLVRSGATAWQIPSYRADLQRPIDLIEEIARVHGLAGVPARLRVEPSPASGRDAFHDHVVASKSRLASLGWFEARTLKLISRAQLADAFLPDAAAVPLKNPLSEDHTHLRPSIIPGLLPVAARNRSMGAARLAFFETGTIFQPAGDDVRETQSIALLLAGAAGAESWADAKPREATLADLRAAIDQLLPPGRKLKVQAVDRPGCILAAELSVSKKEPLGWFGQIAPARARELDCPFPVYVAELDMDRLHELRASKPPRFEELPKFPAITRDIALEVPADFPASRIDAALGNVAEPLLESWSVFDVFADPTGTRLPADRKSLAWSLVYRDRTRTLRSEEVDAAHSKVRDALAKLQGVSPR